MQICALIHVHVANICVNAIGNIFIVIKNPIASKIIFLLFKKFPLLVINLNRLDKIIIQQILRMISKRAKKQS